FPRLASRGPIEALALHTSESHGLELFPAVLAPDCADRVLGTARWNAPTPHGCHHHRRARACRGREKPAGEVTDAARGGTLRTAGFRQRRGTDGRSDVRLCWPIWTANLSLSAARSTLTLPAAGSETAEAIRQRGIAARFESRRLTIGKFRCFSPASPV
ncbi:MAG: hypothetical protein L6Q93_16975, partial [Phycisphaerae bacterium]|nr:hypothetical protein [Phycisphaerae bacterium]